MGSSTIARRILILEISATGHHPTYVRWLLESEFAKSSELILAARKEMFEHPEILACQSKFTRCEINISESLKARLSDFSSLGLMRARWAIGHCYREIFASLILKNRLDYVIVPYLDDCIVGLAVCHEAFAGVPWMAITMRTMFHYAEMGVKAPRQQFAALRKMLIYRILKQNSMNLLLTIDPTFASYAQTQSSSVMRKVEYLPDPSTYHPLLPTRTEARLQLDVPEDVVLVLLFGEISARKGVNSLLEAAADPSCSARVHVLLAGRCKDRTRIAESAAFQALEGSGRLHIVDGYVRGLQELQVLAAPDCMWLGYKDFYGMSGVLVLAARHGMPILASEQGLIGYLAKNHDMGMTVEPGRRSSVVTALNCLVNEPERFKRFGRNGAAAFERHDPTELQRLVTENILTKLRLDTPTNE